VGSHSFLENVMPAKRVQTAYRRWKDRKEVELPKEVFWGNMAPEHAATARCRKERMQGKIKMKNEKKNMWQKLKERKKERNKKVSDSN